MHKHTIDGDETLRVMFADDHAVVREGLSVMLARAGIDVIATFDTWTACVRAYRELRPDIVLLDINIPPDNGGLTAVSEILNLDRDAKIVMISVTADPAVISHALELGARGFIAKMSDSHELPQVVRDASRTGRGDPPVFDRRTASSMFANATGRSHDTNDTGGLSPRELTLVRMMAQGDSVLDMARQLHLAKGTISRELTGLYKKLGVANRSEALVTAARLNLLGD